MEEGFGAVKRWSEGREVFQIPCNPPIKSPPRVLSRVFEGYKLSPQNAQLPPQKYCYHYSI